jgi:hypothetical protein
LRKGWIGWILYSVKDRRAGNGFPGDNAKWQIPRNCYSFFEKFPGNLVDFLEVHFQVSDIGTIGTMFGNNNGSFTGG